VCRMFGKISIIGSPFRGAAWPSPDSAIRLAVVSLNDHVQVKVDATIGVHSQIVGAVHTPRKAALT
jgi:hypothetical protein